MNRPVVLDTIHGKLELRRPRSPLDQNKVSLSMCEGAIERALYDALAWGNPLGVMNLSDKDGFVRIRVFTPPKDIVAGLMAALHAGRLVVGVADEGIEDGVEGAAWSAYHVFQARFGKEFNVAMRRHRLAGRDQVASIRQAEDFDVVPALEAAAVVTRMATSAGAGPWQSAAATLTKSIVDMQSSPGQSGFMLLRAPASHAARIVAPEDVITPSKLRKLAATDWIEIQVVDEEDNPWLGLYELVPPQDEKQKGSGGGTIRVNNILPGSCDFDLPRLSAEPSKATQ